MNKIALIIFLFLFTGSIKSQSLDDFYDKEFEIYTPFSGMSSKSTSNNSLGIKQSLNFWGILNLGGSFSKTKPWGISISFGERQMGDLFFILNGLLNKKAKVRDFRGLNYLSDFGFLPNFRLGLNVYGKENMVVNVGLNHSYYITQTGFIIDGQQHFQGVDWLAVGPNVYVDRAFNKWLAIRLSTGPMFTYANGKGIKDNIPKIWEHKIELFTKFGLFAGVDFLKFSKFHDDNDDNIKIRRYDAKLGFRIKI